jgi:hypothetical protein
MQALTLGLALLWLPAFGARAAPNAQQDARALELLNRMAAAYAQLPQLDQTTEFYSTLIPLDPPPPAPVSPPPAGSASRDAAQNSLGKEQKLPHRLRIRLARPNRLYLEWQQPGENTTQVAAYRWISDGKTFWTYRPDRNWYTKERAPGSLRDFARLASMNSGSLEMLMAMGFNPFSKLRDKDTGAVVRYFGAEVVAGVAAEVVVVQTETLLERVEARFYIGRDDCLLRRLIVETTPVPPPPTVIPGKVGDALDELVPNVAPDVPPPSDSAGTVGALRVKSRFRYDNRLAAPVFDAQTFAFTIPEGALLNEPNLPDGKRAQQIQDQQIADLLRQMRQQAGPDQLLQQKARRK